MLIRERNLTHCESRRRSARNIPSGISGDRTSMKANPSGHHHQNQMKLLQLRILVAVAEQENFSEAALVLDMSQSAVSHAIATLEDHLGVVLFSQRVIGVAILADALHPPAVYAFLDILKHRGSG